MPRKAREKSETGIYHIILRGINGQKIFHDKEDHQQFLETIKLYKVQCGYELYAYCFMNNHIHLLLKEGKEDLGLVFRRIGAKYVYWYNQKYKRRGHLFQDRFRSEAVEDESYFLTVLRYIHQNPVKAKIEKDIEKYPWSSYNEYSNEEYIEQKICDTQFGLSLFSKDPKEGLKLFKDFHQEENDDKCLEFDEKIRLNDIEATEIIKEVAVVNNPDEIKELGKEEINKTIKELKNKGLSIRQLERLTGVSFSAIRKL